VLPLDLHAKEEQNLAKNICNCCTDEVWNVFYWSSVYLQVFLATSEIYSSGIVISCCCFEEG